MSDFLNVAKEAAKAALDKKAENVAVLKMDEVTIMTDFFVICTAANRTQAQAIANNVEDMMKEQGIQILHREGLREGTWVLLDYGSIVVHVFQEDMRNFYDLETLWGDAAVIEID